jgi:hypothetical protein
MHHTLIYVCIYRHLLACRHALLKRSNRKAHSSQKRFNAHIIKHGIIHFELIDLSLVLYLYIAKHVIAYIDAPSLPIQSDAYLDSPQRKTSFSPA